MIIAVIFLVALCLGLGWQLMLLNAQLDEAEADVETQLAITQELERQRNDYRTRYFANMATMKLPERRDAEHNLTSLMN